ncbi:hypothetical protein [Burkholderia gladioli]|uniref:hypothetical protein n=1 Tax=Burkholderia gladioli TaxID=28095 RepID=UPI0013DE5C31|nr:hypothetical protein [Burkholderia gladioli]
MPDGARSTPFDHALAASPTRNSTIDAAAAATSNACHSVDSASSPKVSVTAVQQLGAVSVGILALENLVNRASLLTTILRREFADDEDIGVRLESLGDKDFQSFCNSSQTWVWWSGGHKQNGTSQAQQSYTASIPMKCPQMCPQ